MPKKPAPADLTPLELDPRSAAIVLAYAGDGRFVRNTPARHLSAADLARMAYERKLAETAAEGIRPDPLHPDPAIVTTIFAELTARGLFTADRDAIAAAEAELAGPTPDAPADPASDVPADPAVTEG